ncbi:MAG: DUF308 domain-containing protein [Proteobacteria bacterium]|nr:DUF308 domain-containing protein [Pseudomonadota bacterium]
MEAANRTLIAQILTTPWWLQLLRGLLALGFGFYAVTQPVVTLVVLVQFLGAFLCIEGIVLVALAIGNKTAHTKRGYVALRGVFYLLAGVAVLALPLLSALLTAAIVGSFVGIMAIFGGIMEISAGLRPEKGQHNEWSLVLAGGLSLVFGLILLSTPAAFGVGLSMVFGVWSLVSGVVMIGNSFRIRSGKKQLVAFGTQTA